MSDGYYLSGKLGGTGDGWAATWKGQRRVEQRPMIANEVLGGTVMRQLLNDYQRSSPNTFINCRTGGSGVDYGIRLDAQGHNVSVLSQPKPYGTHYIWTARCLTCGWERFSVVPRGAENMADRHRQRAGR